MATPSSPPEIIRVAIIEDTRTLREGLSILIGGTPGLKPPVRNFAPSDDGDPSEVDAFIKMIRELRHQSPAARTDR